MPEGKIQSSGPTERQKEIPEALNGLGRAVSRIEDLQATLTEKLSPVCRPEEPATSADSAEKSSVPLVSKLQCETERIHAQAEALGEIVARLEI